MFRLLSKESNIFSIPVYIAFLMFVFISLNLLDFNNLNITSVVITFAGISLGYFLFNAIALNQYIHLPLFLYTFLVLAFYPGYLDIGFAFTLFNNSLLLLILTSNNDSIRKSSFLLVGAIVAFNFLVFPFSWPMAAFVIFHIIGTSGRVGLNLFRLFFGIILIFLCYFGLMFIVNHTTWDSQFFPFTFDFKLQKTYYPLPFLIPIILLLVYSVSDHFKHYNEKSPISRYKYTFVLIFALAQLLTILFYMGNSFEYLLLLALPVSIIISRMLSFLPKYWMREASLWLIIITLSVFKIATFV